MYVVYFLLSRNRELTVQLATYDRSAFSSVTNVFPAESGAVGCGLTRYYLHTASLFEQEDMPEYVVEFCNAAIVAADQQVGVSVSHVGRFSWANWWGVDWAGIDVGHPGAVFQGCTESVTV